jgi:hypothetical protein
MAVSQILQEIDLEIARLKKARALLSLGTPPTNAPASGPAIKKKKKRNLSPEGRRRIAEAVKKRWAQQKKASAGK